MLLSRRPFLLGLAGLAATACRSEARPAPAPWVPAPVPLPEGFHRGMNFAHLHQRGWGYGSERAQAQLHRLRGLGVDTIAVNPFAYTRSLTAPTLEWGGDPTLTDDDLRQQIGHARALGLAVMMKPHLWSWQFLGGTGNGDLALDAAGWREWFGRYTEFALHYARIAQATGCASLCVGLEYTSASRANPGAWAAVARACRAAFTGPILYAANWYEEFEIFADWDAFDLVGVNAYFPLTEAPSADTSVDALVAGWQPHLDAIERVAKGRPVVFPEAGYRAVTGATTRPWEDHGGPADPDLQARAYEALLRACTARLWFRGIYWWKWFTDLPGEGDPFVPAGGPAEEVLAAWFGGDRGRP